MFFSKIFFSFLLVNQILQISSAISCGNDTGPVFRALNQLPHLSKASPYNLPWTVEIVCYIEGKPMTQTYGAIISGKHILGKMNSRLCEDKLMKMKFPKRSGDPAYFKSVLEPISSMESIKGAPHLALITLKDEFKFGEQNIAACLPNKEDLVSDFDGELIYSRSFQMRIRSYIDSKKNCAGPTHEKNTFCSSFSRVSLAHIKNGLPGTVEREGRHILVGIAYKLADENGTAVYQTLAGHVEAIRKQMSGGVEKTKDPMKSADDKNSASGKPSSIYEVVNKHANK